MSPRRPTAPEAAPYPANYPPLGRPSLLEEVRKLEPMFLAAEQTIEDERRLPDEIVDAMYENGMWRALLPRELPGGLEVHPLEWLDAVEEVSRVNGSVGWLCMLHSGQTFLAPEVMERILEKDRWLTASNVGRAAGKAVRVEGGYRISGRWSFASGSPEATYLSGRSVLYENDEPVTHPRDGLPWYIVGMWPREDVTLIDTWDGHGLRGTGSGDFEIEDLFVPSEMVNEMGVWEREYDRALYRYWFNVLAHGAHALGLARAAIEEVTRLVHVGARRGSYRQARLGKEQIHQWTLGKADTMVRAARAYLWELTEVAYQDAVAQWPVDFDIRVRLQAALLNSVHVSREAIDMLYKIAGVPAVARGNRLERIHRDILTAANHALMAEAAYDRVGQYIMSKDTDEGPTVEIGGINFIPGPYPQHDQAEAQA